jgi:1,2-diacylglycerol 3-beta-galactosyltransferase
MIVAFHPMTADPAVRARNLGEVFAPVITVITDLVTAHLSWRDAAVDRVVVPSEAVADTFARGGVSPERYVPLGLPVAGEFCRPPLSEAEREDLKRELGVRGKFLVVLTGGAEGSGGLRRRAAAILRQVDDVDVAVICGRNRSLRRRLGKVAERTGDGRLTAHGFVANMADWLRCADVVVGKAGPGTIAEATCCGAPLVLTSFVPGQEKGNAEFVTEAGAGVYAPRPRQLAAEIGRLRRDPGALESMRGASGGAPGRGHRHRPLHRGSRRPRSWRSRTGRARRARRLARRERPAAYPHRGRALKERPADFLPNGRGRLIVRYGAVLAV